MYILYGGKLTRAALVEQVMAECEIAYEVREVDTSKAEQKSSEFLKISPAGWVPVLITPEGKTLYETPAINLYLSDKYGAPNLAPAIDDVDRGEFLSSVFYISGMLEPALKRYWFPKRYTNNQSDVDNVRDNALEEVIGYFTIINEKLEKNGPFHLRDRFSLSDLMLAFWSESFADDGHISHLPAVLNCHELVYNRPKLQAHKYEQRDLLRAFNAVIEKSGAY